MEPEATLKNILYLLDEVSQDYKLSKQEVSDNLDEVRDLVGYYSDWIRNNGFRPDFENLMRDWLTDKEKERYNAPAQSQQQLWN